MKRLLVWGWLLLLPGVAAAQGVPTAPGGLLTLEQAVSAALRQNREVQSATLEVGRAEDQLRAAKTLRLPKLQLGLTEAYTFTPLELKFKTGDLGTFPGIGPVPSENTTIRDSTDFHTAVLTRAAQPLSQQYRIGLEVDQLALRRRIAGSNLRLEQQTTAVSVKGAYYEVLMAQTALEAAEEHARALRELSRVVEEQHRREAALRADVLEVQTRLAAAEAQVLTARNGLATRKERLNLWMGQPLEAEYRVSPVSTPTAYEPAWEEAGVRALIQRPEVARARLQREAAENEVRIKRAEYIPDLNLVLSYASPITSEVLPKHVGYVGLELSWEFFDWGRKRQEVAARSKAVEQADQALRQTQDQVLLDLRSQLRRLQETQALYRVAQLGQEAARERERVVRNRYTEQAALLKDALQAQAELAEANHRYAQALLGVWTARAEVDRALGEIQ